MKIALQNCSPDSGYSVTCNHYFDNIQDRPYIGGTMEEMPNLHGDLKFHNNFEVELYYERRQYLLFKIFKRRTNKTFSIKVPISKILSESDDTIKIEFDKVLKELIIIESEIKDRPKAYIEFSLSLLMQNPDYKSGFCFFIKRKNIEGEKIKDMISIYKSEVKKFPKNSNQIDYNLYGLNSYDLCLGNLDLEIVILVFNDSEMKIVADTYYTSVSHLLENPKIVIDNTTTILVNMKLKREYSFAEYLTKSLNINMCLGIDFTASNGGISTSGSLHEYNNQFENPYEKAIRCCGEIIAQYDTDKIFPCFGYGAILPGETEVSHCFNLNFKDDPNIEGINTVLEYYNEAIKKLTFKDPTYFSKIIEKIIELVDEDLSNNKFLYYILVIMTDGKVDDFELTVKSIIKASDLPISIIIVGIGKNKFKNLSLLSNKSNFLTDNSGIFAKRNIVKFIPYIKYETNITELIDEIFNEVPRQIVEYFAIKEISPNQFDAKYSKDK